MSIIFYSDAKTENLATFAQLVSKELNWNLALFVPDQPLQPNFVYYLEETEQENVVKLLEPLQNQNLCAFVPSKELQDPLLFLYQSEAIRLVRHYKHVSALSEEVLNEVRYTFNPGNLIDVSETKALYAEILQLLKNIVVDPKEYELAKQQLILSQMTSVRAITDPRNSDPARKVLQLVADGEITPEQIQKISDSFNGDSNETQEKH